MQLLFILLWFSYLYFTESFSIFERNQRFIIRSSILNSIIFLLFLIPSQFINYFFWCLFYQQVLLHYCELAAVYVLHASFILSFSLSFDISTEKISLLVSEDFLLLQSLFVREVHLSKMMDIYSFFLFLFLLLFLFRSLYFFFSFLL